MSIQCYFKVVHVFGFQQIAFRLEMEVKQIEDSIKRKELSSLINVDQLKREKGLKKAFAGFGENFFLLCLYL